MPIVILEALTVALISFRLLAFRLGFRALARCLGKKDFLVTSATAITIFSKTINSPKWGFRCVDKADSHVSSDKLAPEWSVFLMMSACCLEEVPE